MITRIYWITPIIELQGSKILIRGFRASLPERLGRRGKKLISRAFKIKLTACEPQIIETLLRELRASVAKN